MNRTFLTSLLLAAICTLGAQNLPVPYQLAPDYMQQMLSQVITSDCRVLNISDGSGHYIGHSRQNVFFGWGSYHANGGNCWIGQWAGGKCLFGILIKDGEARVGSDSHHIVYNLTNGLPLRILKDGETHVFSTAQAETYPLRFLRLAYEGDDFYIGEVQGGLPHGQGIYYWVSGNHWYGTFKEGYRSGYGALFATDGVVDHGLWLGNDKQ